MEWLRRRIEARIVIEDWRTRCCIGRQSLPAGIEKWHGKRHSNSFLK